MRLQELNFENMISEKRRIITYGKDGNSVVKPYRTVYCMEQITHVPEHKNLYLEYIEGRSNIYEVMGNVLSHCFYVPANVIVEQLIDFLTTPERLYRFQNAEESFLKTLETMEQNNKFIGNLYIALCIEIGNVERAEHYRKYREDYIKKQEEQERIEYEQAKKQEEMEEEQYKNQINTKLMEAEKKIIEHKDFYNEQINGENTIIHLLMKKYGIKVPLRTQHWANEKLTKIVFHDGEITYRYLKTDSTVFIKYLKELEQIIVHKGA